MQNRSSIIIFGLFVAVVCVPFSIPAEAQETVDNSVYAALLTAHVNDGNVDYGGLKAKQKQLDRYLDQLAKVRPQKLDRNEQMAFYINAYNAWTLKLILDNYPGVKSIKDLGSLFKSPWKKKFVKLDGKTVTLDYIEHDILRPVFKDARVHFAVNCASLSCPPLLDEPYTGAALESQLDTVAKRFINDPKSNYVKGEALYVSRIFKWFGEDFGDDIRAYVKSHAQGDLAKKMGTTGKGLKVKYLDYDWSLNGS